MHPARPAFQRHALGVGPPDQPGVAQPGGERGHCKVVFKVVFKVVLLQLAGLNSRQLLPSAVTAAHAARLFLGPDRLGGLSFPQPPTAQCAETLAQDFLPSTPLLLSNSLTCDGFCPPGGPGLRYAPCDRHIPYASSI